MSEARLDGFAEILQSGCIIRAKLLDNVALAFSQDHNLNHLLLAPNLSRKANVRYLGMGISGGEEGARYGAAIMAGGDESAYQHVSHLLLNVTAKTKVRSCLAFVGDGGAGHFAKMVHNGIEYGVMQLIAETFFIMKMGLGLNHQEMARIFPLLARH